MAKQEGIAVDNCIVESELGYGKFNVKLPNGSFATCHLSGKMRRHNNNASASGKMRQHNIRVVACDRVMIELSPYNLKQGIIIYRYK